MGLGNPRLELVNSVGMADQFMSWLGESREVLAFDTETTGLDPSSDDLRLIQFGDMNKGWAIPWETWGGVGLEAIAKYEEPMVGHNSKFDVRFIERHGNIKMKRSLIHDTRIMCHLIDPNGSTALKPNAARLVDPAAAYASKALDEAMSQQKWTWATVPIDFPMYYLYGALDTVLTAHLYNKIKPTIDATYSAVYEMEKNVQWVLADMEARGSRIDLQYTREKSSELAAFAAGVDNWCKTAYDVNPGSNVQVADKLIELGVDLFAKTKTGKFQLDVDVLTWVIGGESDQYDITQFNEGQMLAYQVLKRRKSEKIRSTYLDNFLESADTDGFVHPRMNQLGARTGRMSMERPALQTLPRGPVVRDCFIPRDGNTLLTADYDGIEMRCLAHFAQDQSLNDAINSGDIHLAMARLIYQDDTIERKDKRRQITKNTNYAKLYGAGQEKIALTAGVSLVEARAFLNQYDVMFPGVKAFQSRVGRTIGERKRDTGVAWVTTPIGRLELANGDKDYGLVNSLIQGMAADVFKEALVRLDETDASQWMVLPVHDEVVFDVPLDSVTDAREIIRKAMHDDRWAVPLTIGIEGPLDRWGQKYS